MNSPTFSRENGDWLRGATWYNIERNVIATVPVPLFPRHAGGPSQKGTGTVAGGRICTCVFIEATEPVPFYDCRLSDVELGW